MICVNFRAALILSFLVHDSDTTLVGQAVNSVVHFYQTVASSTSMTEFPKPNMLRIREANEGVVRLWQKLDFAIIGRLPGALKYPRRGKVDALIMYKWLVPDE